jgi:hypothetical protein
MYDVEDVYLPTCLIIVVSRQTSIPISTIWHHVGDPGRRDRQGGEEVVI